MFDPKIILATAFSAVVLAHGSPRSAAQSIVLTPIAPPSSGAEHLLTPVDQGVADLTAISTSLRQIERGIQEPAGFSQLYRVGGESNLLLRADSGVYALFSESVYANYRGDAVPIVPPGTTFYIGSASLEAALAEPFPNVDVSHLLVTSSRVRSQINPPLIDTKVQTAPPQPAQADATNSAAVLAIEERAMAQRRVLNAPAPQPLPEPDVNVMSIVTDETYRRARVHFLLQQAVAASIDE